MFNFVYMNLLYSFFFILSWKILGVNDVLHAFDQGLHGTSSVGVFPAVHQHYGGMKSRINSYRKSPIGKIEKPNGKTLQSLFFCAI